MSENINCCELDFFDSIVPCSDSINNSRIGNVFVDDDGNVYNSEKEFIGVVKDFTSLDDLESPFTIQIIPNITQ